ncbi:MAG: helix-turn-helix domain-containing protein [Ruminococcus sp.]|nr:helix-turn-helix domain-containing protein [Ruminococcus sp.]
MFYGKKLQFLREKYNLTQAKVAEILNLDKGAYCNYENEVLLIPLKYLNAICHYFNVSLDYIFSFSEIENYNKCSKDINSELSSKRLKEFRKENNLTQVKLANILNTVHQSIANYENNKVLIPTPFLYTICKKYYISADYLLGKTDNPKYLK